MKNLRSKFVKFRYQMGENVNEIYDNTEGSIVKKNSALIMVELFENRIWRSIRLDFIGLNVWKKVNY